MLISYTGPVDPKTTAGQPKQKKEKSSASGEKRNATLRECIKVLDWYHVNGKNQSKTARHFKKIYPDINIKQPLVSSWVKGEAKWRQDWAASVGKPCAQDARHVLQTEHPEDRAGIPSDKQLSLSEGWLARLKDRHDLRSIKRHREAASVDAKTVAAEREHIHKIIKERGFQPRDIYNMDETGLFYQYVCLLNVCCISESHGWLKPVRVCMGFACGYGCGSQPAIPVPNPPPVMPAQPPML